MLAGCGESGVPGVYTDVSGFRDWIDNQVALRAFDSHSYMI